MWAHVSYLMSEEHSKSALWPILLIKKAYYYYYFFLLYPTLTYFPVRGLALGGLSVRTSTSKETVGRQE